MSFSRSILVIASAALALPSPMHGGKLIRFQSRIIQRPAGKVDVQTLPADSPHALAASPRGGIPIRPKTSPPLQAAGRLTQTAYQPDEAPVSAPQPLPGFSVPPAPAAQSDPGSPTNSPPAPATTMPPAQPQVPIDGAWYPTRDLSVGIPCSECGCAEQNKQGRLLRLRQHFCKATLWWRLKHQESCQCLHGDSYYDPIAPYEQPAYGHHQTCWRRFPESCYQCPPEFLGEMPSIHSVGQDLRVPDPPALPPLPSVLTFPQPIAVPPLPPLPDLPLPDAPTAVASGPVQMSAGTQGEVQAGMLELDMNSAEPSALETTMPVEHGDHDLAATEHDISATEEGDSPTAPAEMAPLPLLEPVMLDSTPPVDHDQLEEAEQGQDEPPADPDEVTDHPAKPFILDLTPPDGQETPGIAVTAQDDSPAGPVEFASHPAVPLILDLTPPVDQGKHAAVAQAQVEPASGPVEFANHSAAPFILELAPSDGQGRLAGAVTDTDVAPSGPVEFASHSAAPFVLDLTPPQSRGKSSAATTESGERRSFQTPSDEATGRAVVNPFSEFFNDQKK